MEFLKFKIIDKDNYKEFLSKIEKVKEMLKENKKYESIYTSIDALNNKNIYFYLTLFQNYEKWINFYFENNYNIIDKQKYILIKNFAQKDNSNNEINKNLNFYSLLIIWLLYLYDEFVNYFYAFNPNYSEVNKIRYILRETNNLIVKLYKETIINTSQIFNIIYFYLFLIETNFEVKSYSDKLYKAKNNLLLQGLFFIFQEISVLIINKVNIDKKLDEKENKENILKIFCFLEEFKKNSEINTQLNITILININLIHNLMVRILDKIDINIIAKFEPEFKNKILNFFSHFLKFNYKKSKIFNSILNTLKQSFINLYNFENNKKKIIHDFFKNNFYIKLLKKIFYFDENSNNNISRPLFDTFYFNGFDSQISLNVQQNNNTFDKKKPLYVFEKSTLFFSFYLCPLEGRSQYPLFVIQKDFDNKKTDLLYLYLKQNDKNNTKNNFEEFDVCISIEGKEKKLDKLPKIKKHMTYYFALCFNSDKLIISFCNKKEEIFSTEIDKNSKLLAINSISFTFGFYKKRINVLSGFFGPIIILKNPKNSKELIKFINSVLKLGKNYRNYIFLNDNSNYLAENDIYLKNNINNELEYKLEEIEFLLYLMPDNFRFFSEKSSMVNHLPNIDSICKYQRKYNIYNLNISLIKHEQGIINFLMDNGLNYICLLYEYIYQFAENYTREGIQENNEIDEYKDIIKKMIISIIRKTLFILEKNHNEINLIYFKKPLKQTYMNLFTIINKIIPKFFIVEDLIDHIFCIIKNYHNYISNFIKKKKLFTNDSIKLISNEINNNNELQINLCFMNGWIDFLLNPIIYELKKQDTLKKLLNELIIFFNYIKLNKTTEKINQNLFLKLLNLLPFINIFYNQKDSDNNRDNENINNDNIKDKNQINRIENEKDILDLYFNALKIFFENNPSKSENINNFKNIFKLMYDNISQNSQLSYKFNNFLDDSYFYDDKDDQQIKLFLKYAFKFSQNVNENLEAKNEKEINNKRNLFNKLFSILIRIMYNKERIGRNDKILYKFKKKLVTIEKTKDLVIIISNELINIFNNIFLINNKINKKSEENQNKKENKKTTYEKEELDNLSNFYFSIFDLILFFLEYPIDNNDKMIANIIIIEEIIVDLLSKIANILKSSIENNNKNDNNNNNMINSEEDDKILDIIYCLINFLKFYDTIFYQKIYSQKYVQNFIDICELCFKTSLIYSNILIEINETSCIEKVPLEIILDISIFYISLTSSKYCENLSDNEISKDSIVEEQRILYDFLNKLLYPQFIKDSKNKTTIFFINDYIRYLSNLIDNKKRPKNDKFYSEYQKEINMYQVIDKLLSNEKKYTSNFSTFFILKCNGYKKILFELIVKVLMVNPQAKDFLKFDDILTLMIGVIQQNYLEHEILYAKNKTFFFNSKKVSTSYENYNIIKKKIESNLKKNNYSEIDDYILDNIFKKDFDNVYTLIYSGLCISKKKAEHKLSAIEKEEPKKIRYVRHALSSTNVIKQIKQDHGMERSFSGKKERKLTKSINESSFEGNNSSEKESSITQDEYEYSLAVEETPSSDINNNKLDNIEENLNIDLGVNTINSNYSSPLNNEYKKLRKQTFNSAFSLGDNLELSDKNSKSLRHYSILSEISIDSNDEKSFPYFNYFNEPDECYLKNVKKELMMTVFSFYFYDVFFNNENFKLMKTYYLQKFEKIQISTKLLDYPTKIKYFNNGLEPNLFLKPFPSFFTNKIFPITHKYFYDYMNENNIKEYEPIILYKKILPEVYLEEKFDIKCELIKINRCFYGHMIGSKNAKYLIFEQQRYDFYDELSDSNKNKELNLNQPNNRDLNNLFTLSNISKKPFNKKRKNSLSLNNESKKHKKYKRDKTLVILFDEIDEILDRRFLLMWQAIEIYLKNGKSYFFNLLSKEQHKFILDIFKNNTITKNKIHMKDSFKAHIKKLIIEWQEERLSTYEYLLFLNKYGTRTFNDVNQYPIFPWLIRKFKVDDKSKKIEEIFRNFKYPMAAQVEDNRLTALNRFEDDEQTNVKFPVHYGTHYSTSSYIYFYLMREEPFTTLLVKLQGYKQENPDRMFFSLIDTLFVLETGSDNRESIPDIFCKIEQFINLNCADFGKKNNGNRVDDFIIFKDRNALLLDDNSNNINYYVDFIIENKKLLDEKNISSNINDWFDIVFGIGQLPEKNLKKCLNIFNKETYEQKTNLHEKLIKLQKKCKKEEDIIKKIENKIDLIISFGQTPYQLFNEKHPKNERVKKSQERIENDDDGDFETILDNCVWDKNIKGAIDTLPIFFEINPSLGKVFLIDKNRSLQIIDSNYYNRDEESKKHFYLKKLVSYQLSHIKFLEKMKIQDNSKFSYYIHKPKYCFSSFNEKAISNELDDAEFSSYYNLYINNICNENKQDSKRKSTYREEYLRFITCRYMDNSFKIHNINKKMPQKEENPISIICEDFVSACCTLNYNKFFIGLKNGKLIQWSIENEIKEVNTSKDINLKIDKQIQAHKNTITVIEINIRLGIIITGGEDNYVFIRKIYDLELITPIKLKSKYIITMAKISPMNFLYIMCFNKKKKKNKSLIFGYTLNGLLFAKSKYGYYDSIDFTKNGNIISYGSKKEIIFLYGNNLKNIIVNKDDKEMNEVLNKISGASWIKYNYFYRKHDINQFINKILTYTIYDKSKGGNLIQTLDVSKINYFD